MRHKENKVIKGSESIYIKGNKTGFLLIHGFSSTPWEFTLLADYLAEKGNTVSVPLLSGHGTFPEDLRNYSWYDWFEDIKTKLFELRKKCKNVYVVGQSGGAILALHLAAHYQLEGVVALSPVIAHKSLKHSCLIPAFIKIRQNKKGTCISDKNEREQAIFYNKIPVKALREVEKLNEHVHFDFKDIYTRLLIIHSKSDKISNIKNAKYIYHEVSSKNKHFLTLENSFHIVTRDIEKEIVFREIGHFVDNLPVR